MLLRNAIDRVQQHTPQPFVTPIITEKVTNEVFVVQNDVPLKYNVVAPHPGWWWCVPSDNYVAHAEREAAPWEVDKWLGKLPTVHLVTALNVGEGSWICMPYNMADARQKGWSGRPVRVELVDENVKPLDVIKAALTVSQLGYFLFVEASPLDALAAQRAKECVFGEQTINGVPRVFAPAARIALENLLEQIRKEKEREILERIERENATLEERIRFYLEFVGARLVDWRRGYNEIEVTTQYEDGYTHTFVVDTRARGVSAGICLDGTENRHNLSSLVMALQKARELHRFDLDEAAWL